MTERKIRNEIVKKIPDAKRKRVVDVLDQIENEIGRKAFLRIFVTLTCDGGSEFMDIECIERHCIDENVERMNNYPRKTHGGLTPAMIYKNCCYF